MPKKDITQVNAIAKEFKMNSDQRDNFGIFLEAEKRLGYGGTKNKRGDFTYQELRQKAREFLGLD